MHVDRTAPHAFKPDRRGEDGLFKLGFCRFYLLVDDDKAEPPPKNANPKTLRDSARARYQLRKWRHLDVRDTETGETERGPQQRNDDFGNGLMFCVHDGLPVAAPLTAAEWMREHFPAIRETEEKAKSRPLTPGEEMAYAVNVAHARQQHKSGRRRFDEWNKPI